MRLESKLLLTLAAGVAWLASASSAASSRPNILWLSCEDISPQLHCYGDPNAITPNLDNFARDGIRFTHAFTVAGVCAPSRSGIIMGMYPTTLGSQHMRSRIRLPEGMRPFPSYLRDAGYYCTNNGKTDYNFNVPPGVWDQLGKTAHWRNRPRPDQPFFAVFNFNGTHEDRIARPDRYREATENLSADQRQDSAKFKLPAYYADTPIAREHWKRYLEIVTAMDAWFGRMIQQLKDDGLYDNTIVFFWSDHGVGLPRAKRWVYDSGTRIPLIIHVPAAYRTDPQDAPGTVTDRLVSGIDFGPTVLALAGVPRPDFMQGQPFLGADRASPREYVYAARDRMDERYDVIRMVRDQRYQYVRNYEPLKPGYQFMFTPEKDDMMRELRSLHETGQLAPAAERYFAPEKPTEELYDTETDPDEIHNLAGDPRYAEILARLAAAQQAWARDTGDLGLIPEPVLVEREQELGSRYAILRQPSGETLARRVTEIAIAASSGPSALPELLRAAHDPDDAMRYWGATGVGNIGAAAGSAAPAMKQLLSDSSPVVRVAAARALCRLGDANDALPILTQVLRDGQQWERLHAAIVLDEIGDQARPAIPALRDALEPRKDLFAGGKYVVRVVTHALEQLGEKIPGQTESDSADD